MPRRLPSTLLALGLCFAAATARSALPEDQPPAAPADRLLQGAPVKPAAAPVVPEPPPARGQLLYDTHCQGCHRSIVHLRDDRRATSLAAVRGWVRRWSNELKLGWEDGDVNQVADYLDRRYYKFSARPPGGR